METGRTPAPPGLEYYEEPPRLPLSLSITNSGNRGCAQFLQSLLYGLALMVRHAKGNGYVLRRSVGQVQPSYPAPSGVKLGKASSHTANRAE